MTKTLHERVLVVTGGASGIGEACALRMADSHDAVVLIDRDKTNLARAAKAVSEACADSGVPVHTHTADVTDPAEMTRLAADIEQQIGAVQTLIPSAGILNNSETILDMDLAEHDRVWQVNYNGVIYTIRAFAAAMQSRNRGAIATLGSMTGLGAFPLPAYSPSKTAIARLTEILAVELGRNNIRVNGVAPTYVMTPAVKSRIDAGHRDPTAILKSGAIEMMVEPVHIANVINFLCSEQAAAITGVVVPVDAGWSAVTPYRSYAGGVPWEKDGQ
jgi:NAD(P)-dependent dehydrogenase (short-subunit alcohol dehydrogenase family)